MDSVAAVTQTDGTREGMGKNTVSMDMQSNKKYFRPMDQSEQLFRRLPDEITLSGIVSKLPWRAFHILAAVSHAWRQAIQTHRVHDARIHSCSTDTLVLHGHRRLDYYRNGSVIRTRRLAVYSTRDKLCYHLPPIPGHHRGLPRSCECISLDGKIYVIGGAGENHLDNRGSSKVYVLDLAVASHWKECASMERARRKFGCGVVDKKIYVFGGTHEHAPVRGAEVYNPKINAWSPITPMASMRSKHKVLTLAEKIVVHGGDCYDPSYNKRWILANSQPDPDSPFTKYDSYPAKYLEVYHPLEDKWTWNKPLSNPDEDDISSGSVFVVRGQLHVMTEVGLYVDDNDTYDRSWKLLHSNAFPSTRDIGPIGSVEVEMCVSAIATVVLNDELLALVVWHDEFDASNHGSALLQSKGFGTEDETLVWKVLSKCPGAFGDFMCCIQL